MKRMRNKIFETNSSSTHSFAVATNLFNEYKLPITIEPDWSGKFGWSFKEWHTKEEKLAYIIRCLADSFEDVKAVQERFKEYDILFELPDLDEWGDGYVDHPDWYAPEIEEIIEDGDLYNFLLDEHSYILGGNDNE